MLVLSRKQAESILINNDIEITVLAIQGNRVRLGISAPLDVPITRSELKSGICQEADWNDAIPFSAEAPR